MSLEGMERHGKATDRHCRGELPAIIAFAGDIGNSPDDMAEWIEGPQPPLPGTAMPRMDTPQQDARAIAAFLDTLKYAR